MEVKWLCLVWQGCEKFSITKESVPLAGNTNGKSDRMENAFPTKFMFFWIRRPRSISFTAKPREHDARPGLVHGCPARQSRALKSRAQRLCRASRDWFPISPHFSVAVETKACELAASRDELSRQRSQNDLAESHLGARSHRNRQTETLTRACLKTCTK